MYFLVGGCRVQYVLMSLFIVLFTFSLSFNYSFCLFYHLWRVVYYNLHHDCRFDHFPCNFLNFFWYRFCIVFVICIGFEAMLFMSQKYASFWYLKWTDLAGRVENQRGWDRCQDGPRGPTAWIVLCGCPHWDPAGRTAQGSRGQGRGPHHASNTHLEAFTGLVFPHVLTSFPAASFLHRLVCFSPFPSNIIFLSQFLPLSDCMSPPCFFLRTLKAPNKSACIYVEWIMHEPIPFSAWNCTPYNVTH